MSVFPPFYFIWNDKLTLQYFVVLQKALRWVSYTSWIEYNSSNRNSSLRTETNRFTSLSRYVCVCVCVDVVSLPLKCRHNFRYSVLAQSTFVIQIYSITFFEVTIGKLSFSHIINIPNVLTTICLHTNTNHLHMNADALLRIFWRESKTLCYTCCVCVESSEFR